MKELEEVIKLLNPWWKEKDIDESLAKLYKRKIFSNILKLINYRQIIILSGLRRIGKTTSMYQIIEYLIKIKKIDPRRIFYFNFDKKVEEVIEILNTYKDITGIDWTKEKVFVFFDEIANLDKWANKVKLIYDSQPIIKFVISSSASTTLEEEAIKNLGGRYFLINIKPLSFTEYLELRGKEGYLKKSKLYEEEIKKESEKYMIISFPEIVNWKDELLIKDYLRTTIIDKIVRSDLPEKFKNVNKELLFNLLEMFYKEPGVYLDYDSLSRKLRVSKKTLLEHIFYLEFSYLLRKVKNFRPGIFTSSRKMQRVYPYWGSLAYCYSDNKDKIMENIVASKLDAKFYWRKNGKEVDFLTVEKKKIVPFEVKNKEEITNNDLKNMKYFLRRYKIRAGFVIYNGEEGEIKVDRKYKIKFIPLWKWLLS